MLYLVAIILPPLAVLLCGKPLQALLNLLLTLLFYLPGMIHALVVVADHRADKRSRRIERAVRQSGTGPGRDVAGARDGPTTGIDGVPDGRCRLRKAPRQP